MADSHSFSSMTLRGRHLIDLRGGVPDRIPWNCYDWIIPQIPATRILIRQGLGLMGTRRIYTEISADVTIHSESYVVDGLPHEHVVLDTPFSALTEDAAIKPGYGSRWIKKYFISSEVSLFFSLL